MQPKTMDNKPSDTKILINEVEAEPLPPPALPSEPPKKIKKPRSFVEIDKPDGNTTRYRHVVMSTLYETFIILNAMAFVYAMTALPATDIGKSYKEIENIATICFVQAICFAFAWLWRKVSRCVSLFGFVFMTGNSIILAYTLYKHFHGEKCDEGDAIGSIIFLSWFNGGENITEAKI